MKFNGFLSNMSRLTGVPLHSNNGSQHFGGSGMGTLNTTPLGLNEAGQQERRRSQMESHVRRLE